MPKGSRLLSAIVVTGVLVLSTSARAEANPLSACLLLIDANKAGGSVRAFDACRWGSVRDSGPADDVVMKVAGFYRDNYLASEAWPAIQEWVAPLAQRGHAEALFQLANTYPTGSPRGLSLYSLAAQQGSDNAQYYLARLYNEGTLVPRDEAAGHALLVDLASRGHDGAEQALLLQEYAATRLKNAADNTARQQALDFLATIVVEFVVYAIEHPHEGTESTQPSTVSTFNPCAGYAEAYAWSGDKQAMGAAAAIGGCSLF